MKKSLILIAMMFLIFSQACSKKNDSEPEKEDAFHNLPMNIVDLVSFVGQDYDVVRKTLDKYAMLEKSSMGDRNFSVTITDGEDIKLSGKIIELNKKVNEISVQYSGVVGGPSIGDPYENELWYHYITKVHGIYGESTTRLYNKSGGFSPTTNEALINTVKTQGYSGASYMALWQLENKTKELSVFHSSSGRFLLKIILL